MRITHTHTSRACTQSHTLTRTYTTIILITAIKMRSLMRCVHVCVMPDDISSSISCVHNKDDLLVGYAADTLLTHGAARVYVCYSPQPCHTTTKQKNANTNCARQHDFSEPAQCKEHTRALTSKQTIRRGSGFFRSRVCRFGQETRALLRA